MVQTPAERLILIADDNHDLARCMGFLLQFAGFKTKITYDGLEAVAAMSKDMPDIALLDIGLPGLNGFEVAEHIRAQQGTKPVLIIAISGYSREQVATFSHSVFDYYFIKPVDVETLLPLFRRVN